MIIHLTISVPKDSPNVDKVPYGASVCPKIKGYFPYIGTHEQIPKSYMTSIISDTSCAVARHTMLTNIVVLDCK